MIAFVPAGASHHRAACRPLVGFDRAAGGQEINFGPSPMNSAGFDALSAIACRVRTLPSHAPPRTRGFESPGRVELAVPSGSACSYGPPDQPAIAIPDVRRTMVGSLFRVGSARGRRAVGPRVFRPKGFRERLQIKPFGLHGYGRLFAPAACCPRFLPTPYCPKRRCAAKGQDRMWLPTRSACTGGVGKLGCVEFGKLIAPQIRLYFTNKRQ